MSAWPKGRSRLWPSPAPNPSVDSMKFCTRTSCDMGGNPRRCRTRSVSAPTRYVQRDDAAVERPRRAKLQVDPLLRLREQRRLASDEDRIHRARGDPSISPASAIAARRPAPPTAMLPTPGSAGQRATSSATDRSPIECSCPRPRSTSSRTDDLRSFRREPGELAPSSGLRRVGRFGHSEYDIVSYSRRPSRWTLTPEPRRWRTRARPRRRRPVEPPVGPEDEAVEQVFIEHGHPGHVISLRHRPPYDPADPHPGSSAVGAR